ncbi:hypothetical protein Tco_1443017, partial [Tanacetum coccineum]
ETEDVYGVYELYNLDHDTEEKGISTDVAALAHHPDIEHLIARFETPFQVPTTLPPYRSVDHRIHLYPNTKPVNVRPYHYPHYQKGEMEKFVNEMLSQVIIRVIHCPFLSPVLLVKKKDKNYRFCVDYRALNEATIKDKFQIPTVDEMFDELGGAVIFTKLDLRAGYHQIWVHDRDVYKMPFVRMMDTMNFCINREHRIWWWMHYPERMKKTRRSQQLFYGLKSARCGVAGRLKVRERDLRRAFSTSPSDGPGRSFRRFSTGAGATPVS